MRATARLMVALVLIVACAMAGYLVLTAGKEPPERLWVYWLVFTPAAVSCLFGASSMLRSRRSRA